MQDNSQSWTWEGLGVLIIFLAFIGTVAWAVEQGGRSEGRLDAYAAFRDGRAQVIEYTVPGSGKCRAVLIDGERKAEVCGDR